MANTDAKQSPESETLSIATVTAPKLASSGPASTAAPLDRVAIPNSTSSSVPTTHAPAAPPAPVAASATTASAPPALSSSVDAGKATDDTKKQSQFRRNVFDASLQCLLCISSTCLVLLLGVFGQASGVTPLERACCPEWFCGDSAKSPDHYIEARNWMIAQSNSRPQNLLTVRTIESHATQRLITQATFCRQRLGLDACATIRLFNFVSVAVLRSTVFRPNVRLMRGAL